jgi:hypothetical protein
MLANMDSEGYIDLDLYEHPPSKVASIVFDDCISFPPPVNFYVVFHF